MIELLVTFLNLTLRIKLSQLNYAQHKTLHCLFAIGDDMLKVSGCAIHNTACSWDMKQMRGLWRKHAMGNDSILAGYEKNVHYIETHCLFISLCVDVSSALTSSLVQVWLDCTECTELWLSIIFTPRWKRLYSIVQRNRTRSKVVGNYSVYNNDNDFFLQPLCEVHKVQNQEM